MNEVAVELGSDWHTVNDAVIAYTVLVDHPDRIGEPTAIRFGRDAACRQGPWRSQCWSTSIVDVGTGRLLDVVAGRGAAEPCRWMAERGEKFVEGIAWATLDLSGLYRSVFDTLLPGAAQIADPFSSGEAGQLEAGRVPTTRAERNPRPARSQGRSAVYRCRRLLTRADERFAEKGRTKLLGLFDAGDPGGEVRAAWHPRRPFPAAYEHHDAKLAMAFVERVGKDLQDQSPPEKVRSLGRTLVRWKDRCRLAPSASQQRRRPKR